MVPQGQKFVKDLNKNYGFTDKALEKMNGFIKSNPNANIPDLEDELKRVTKGGTTNGYKKWEQMKFAKDNFNFPKKGYENYEKAIFSNPSLDPLTTAKAFEDKNLYKQMRDTGFDSDSVSSIVNDYSEKVNPKPKPQGPTLSQGTKVEYDGQLGLEGFQTNRFTQPSNTVAPQIEKSMDGQLSLDTYGRNNPELKARLQQKRFDKIDNPAKKEMTIGQHLEATDRLAAEGASVDSFRKEQANLKQQHANQDALKEKIKSGPTYQRNQKQMELEETFSGADEFYSPTNRAQQAYWNDKSGTNLNSIKNTGPANTQKDWDGIFSQDKVYKREDIERLSKDQLNFVNTTNNPKLADSVIDDAVRTDKINQVNKYGRQVEKGTLAYNITDEKIKTSNNFLDRRMDSVGGKLRASHGSLDERMESYARKMESKAERGIIPKNSKVYQDAKASIKTSANVASKVAKEGAEEVVKEGTEAAAKKGLLKGLNKTKIGRVAATVGVGALIVSNMSKNKGQQPNQQLYGQQTPYSY